MAVRPRVGGAVAVPMVLAVLALLVQALLSGCTAGARQAPVPEVKGTVTVYAPASLTEILTAFAADFELHNPNLTVKVIFGADSEMTQSAMADVASTGTAADPRATVLIVEGRAPLDTLGSLADPSPVTFARNQLVVAIAPGNPKRLVGVGDLARPDLRVVLCAETEPCGTTSAAVLTAAGVKPLAPIRVPDVRTALAQVEQGKADAALVYRTDTRIVDDTVGTLEFAESRAALAEYQAVVLAGSSNAHSAQVFLNTLASTAMAETLAAAGFQVSG